MAYREVSENATTDGGEKLDQISAESAKIKSERDKPVVEGQGIQEKNNLIHGETARACAKQSKHFEAVSQLEEVRVVQHQRNLGLILLEAECYIQLGREQKAEKAITAVKQTIQGKSSVEAELLISLGESLGDDNSFLRSIILLQMASDIYKKSDLSPNEIVDGISRCIQEAKQILSDVTKEKSSNVMDLLKRNELKQSFNTAKSDRLRVIVLDYGIEYMKNMLSDLRAVKGADPEKKTIKEAWSCTHIGFVYGNVKEFDKSYKIRKEGVDTMDREFGDRASHYRLYGILLHNMGIVLHNSQKYAEAKATYEKTIKAKERATDISSSDKLKDVEETRKALDITRNHIAMA